MEHKPEEGEDREGLPDSDPFLLPGTRIDRYVILSPLGLGGMGAAYKARDTTLDEVVALKVLPAAADPVSARRFVSEIRLARKVTHRHVCRINEYGEDGGRRYIAMELVEGAHLRALLTASGPAPLHRGLEISRQIADGLQAIHEAGIVHRDIKSSNVMLDAHGLVKIMDLGIAKLQGAVDQESTAAGLIVGTPYYMSPEQARGETLDGRSDLYSLGVVMFELFTGELPFRGDSPLSTLMMHLEAPPPLERLPAPLRPVVGRALAKNARERFTTARELAEALPIGPAPPSPAAEQEWPQRSPGTAATPARTPPPAAARPLADLSGLTRAIGVASAARDRATAAFPTRSRLSEPDFGQVDVFICYRRGDSEDVSGRIHDRLVAAFGHQSVFKDVDSIPPGANFKKYLQAVVQRCLVQLVVIGGNWVDARDEAGQRRLEDPGDWVRIEIEAALQRDVPIIPLLVHSASMPREHQLPASLGELAYLQGASVRRDPDFHVDMDRLISALEKYLPHTRKRP